jgi:beta-barrel assembly-enhancing protease
MGGKMNRDGRSRLLEILQQRECSFKEWNCRSTIHQNLWLERLMFGKQIKAILIAGAAVVLCAVSIAAFGQGGAAVDLNDMRAKVQTRAREMTIGRQASRRFERRVMLVKDTAVLQYIDAVAQNVARSSDAKVPITIKIVDTNEVNALSFPGGFLYISSGLLLAVDNDAEIASVIAHEVAHVVARDGMKTGRYLGMGDPSPVISANPDAAGNMTDLGGFLVPLKFVASPRETEADIHGIQYLQKAGYDPKGFITFLEKMQAMEKTELNNVIGLFQTHPPTTERIRLIQEQIGTASTTPLQADTTTELRKIQEVLKNR